MQKRDLIKTVVLFVSIILVTVVSALLLNLVTGPKIAADKAYRDELAAQQAAGELLQVFPGATGFEDITADLTIKAEARVDAVYKETSGKGYVVIARWTIAPMKDDVIVTFGVADGKVVGLIYKLVNENDYSVDNSTINSVIGNDSTLGGFVITAGCTKTSDSIKTAVSNGFLVLAENDLMKAKAKETEQVFEELLPTVLPNFVKGDAIDASGNIEPVKQGGIKTITQIRKGASKTAMNMGINPHEMSNEELDKFANEITDFASNFQVAYDAFIARYGEDVARKDPYIGQMYDRKKALSYNKMIEINRRFNAYKNNEKMLINEFENYNGGDL